MPLPKHSQCTHMHNVIDLSSQSLVHVAYKVWPVARSHQSSHSLVPHPLLAAFKHARNSAARGSYLPQLALKPTQHAPHIARPAHSSQHWLGAQQSAQRSAQIWCSHFTVQTWAHWNGLRMCMHLPELRSVDSMSVQKVLSCSPATQHCDSSSRSKLRSAPKRSEMQQTAPRARRK